MQALRVPLTAFPGHLKRNLVCCLIWQPYVLPEPAAGGLWQNLAEPRSATRLAEGFGSATNTGLYQMTAIT